MKTFCKRLCCAIFCCRCSKSNDDTRLLPKNEKTRALLEKNEIHCYGVIPDNLRGQIIDVSKYTKSFVRKIVCGTNHCLILFNDGQLAGFGGNEEGQLGFSLIKENKYINEIKLNKFTVTDPETGRNIENYEIWDIGAGENYSLVLIRTSMKLLLVKFGIKHEDRYLDDLENIKTVNIVELDYHKINNISKIFVFGQRSVLLTSDNHLYVGGIDFNMNPLSKYKHLEHFGKQIRNVHLGLGHCLILDFDGGVYAVGDNTYGELGIENEIIVEKPTRVPFQFESNIKKLAVGARHSLILLNNGDLYAFGDNSDGQCTGFNTRYSFPVKVEVETREKIVDVYSGYNHNLIVLANGEMLTWGDTASGKLGYFESNMTQSTSKLIQILKGKYANYVSLGFQMTVISTSNFENSLVQLSIIN